MQDQRAAIEGEGGGSGHGDGAIGSSFGVRGS
jgi:hypothetical protein